MLICSVINKLLRFLFTFFILLQCFTFKAQGHLIANPYINNYSKQQYKGGTENWDISTTSDGQIFVANNEGMLRFCGNQWKLYKLPNKTVVRSIEIDTILNRIYIGGQDEFGYFSSNANGELDYHDLTSVLSGKFKSLEDVWDIQINKSEVYFRSLNTLFKYDGRHVYPVIDTRSDINFFKIVKGELIFGDSNKGILKIINGKTEAIPGGNIFQSNRISDIIAMSQEKWLIVTEKSGVYAFENGKFRPFLKDERIKRQILNSIVFVNPNVLAIGTVLNGIVFINPEGEQIFNITKKQGLQNNAVIKLASDNNGNIWAGTTNGIDQLLIDSPYRIVYADGDLQGGVYAVKIFDGKLYVGTNNGLFYTEWKEGKSSFITGSFHAVENSSGQVWGLDIVHGELFMAHNEGAFIIHENRALKLSGSSTGSWRFLSLTDKNRLLVGAYNGFHIYIKQGENWNHEKHLSGFRESARIVATDHSGNVWVSHPYRKVYSMTLSPDYSSFSRISEYGIQQGLPSNLGNYVVNLQKDIYVNSEGSIYKWDTLKRVFQVESRINSLIGASAQVRRLFQNQESGIWYVAENECGVLHIVDGPLSKSIFKTITPFLEGKLIGGFELIYDTEGNHVFACTDKGLIVIDKSKLLRRRKLDIHFDEIINDGKDKRTAYGGYRHIPEDGNSTFDSKQQNMYFSVYSNRTDPTEPVYFLYKMDKIEDTWSEPTTSTYREYKNLMPGNYTMHVTAKDVHGNTSEELLYQFKIRPPWYISKWAYAVYFLFIILSGLLTYKLMNKRHEKEKSRLISEKELSDAKVEALLNEKLQAEIIFKNKELALSTMHIVQKNETLSKLREELDSIMYQTRENETKSQIKKVIQILSDDERLEEDWESFALHFDQVHTDFLRRIKDDYAQLSPKDLKLCAYLRMNLSTKEIAPLLNISVRGIEISRYRLRKKMHLDPDINLTEFMMKY